MNFTTVAKLAGGSHAFSALGGPTGKLLEQAAPAFGKCLDKAAEKLPGLLDKLSEKLDRIGNPHGNANAKTDPLSQGQSLRAALFAQQQWDSNQDGNLSKEELTEAVDKANGYLKAFGSKLLENYDAVAKLDNHEGVSIADLKLLAFNDNRPHQISDADWATIANPVSV